MTYENDIPDYALVPAKEIEERTVVPVSYTHLDVYKRQANTVSLSDCSIVFNILPHLSLYRLVVKYEYALIIHNLAAPVKLL